MARKSLVITMKIAGFQATKRKLAELPDDARETVKDAAFELSQDMASKIRAAARSSSRQAALMAPTVSTGTDNGIDSDYPVVWLGGSSKVGRKRKPAFKILFGAEFGATYLKQFRPRNVEGYFVYPTVNAMAPEIGAAWLQAADEAIARVCEGGDDEDAE